MFKKSSVTNSAYGVYAGKGAKIIKAKWNTGE